MKHALSALALIWIVMALTACQKSDDNTDQAVDTASQPADKHKSKRPPVAEKEKPATAPRKNVTVSDPNPIQVCDGTGVGQTTISWDAGDIEMVEVRILAPNGRLMAKGSKGSSETGKWVKDGMTFYLVDSSNGTVLDKIKVKHTREGCP